eukprot:gene13105-3892_t
MTEKVPLRLLELYSGIGGMQFAMKGADVPYCLVAAMELNDVANKVYKHNFPGDNLMQKNIEGLSVKEMEILNADIILMSPPCQPFTRIGNQKASEDPRTKSFLNILRIIKSMANPPKYILLENVKGFETSETREQLLSVLISVGYNYQEFLISPLQFGVPNSRLRYYLLAKLKPLNFQFPTSSEPIDHIPYVSPEKQSADHCDDVIVARDSIPYSCCRCGRPCLKVNGLIDPCPLSEYLEATADDEEFYLSGDILGRLGTVLDIVTPSSKRSCCFTKAYGTYVKGTGSVITTMKSESEIQETFESLKDTVDERLRSFPAATTTKQKFKLLGNSINVFVVSQLLKNSLLTDCR